MRSQYTADIKRLTFIVEGEQTVGAIPHATTCPFCDGAMYEETGSQKSGLLKRYVHFPVGEDAVFNGPHIGIANPLFKTSRTVCVLNSDYDNIDLTSIPDSYIQRVNYVQDDQYIPKMPVTQFGEKYNLTYKLVMRKMLNQSGERTLIATIIPPHTGHIDGIFGIYLRKDLSIVASTFASLPYDFFIKVTGKANCRFDTVANFPNLRESKYAPQIAIRGLLLICLTQSFASLWGDEFKESHCSNTWAKSDLRLNRTKFADLTSVWTWDTPLRSDFERRQALVEIDVLTAMALGMTLDQLKTIYRIQFPVLQQYEADTWYDANGRIVFTTNRSLTGVGYDRKTWENEIKGAPAGKKFYRIITDDTQPGGPVERTIEYVAPFDRCDREKDYETAWEFFSRKENK